MLDVARARIAAGDDVLQLNQLAKDAGVGVGTVYRQFPNQQVLLEALAIDAFEQLATVAEQAVAEPDTDTALSRFFSAVVAGELDDPSLAAVLTSELFVCPETTAAGRALLDAAASLLRRGVAESLITPEIEPADVQNLLSGTAWAVKASGDRECLDRYVAVLLRGLRPGRHE